MYLETAIKWFNLIGRIFEAFETYYEHLYGLLLRQKYDQKGRIFPTIFIEAIVEIVFKPF
jgi:hypothetical protein